MVQRTMSQCSAIIVHKVITGEGLEQSAAFNKALGDLLLLGMEIKWKRAKRGNSCSAAKLIDLEVAVGATKLIGILVHAPNVEILAWNAMTFTKRTVAQLPDTFFATFEAKYEQARLEDGPKVLEGDDTVFDQVKLSRDGHFDFFVDCVMKQLKVLTCDLSWGGGRVEKLHESWPAVDEGLKWG